MTNRHGEMLFSLSAPTTPAESKRKESGKTTAPSQIRPIAMGLRRFSSPRPEAKQNRKGKRLEKTTKPS
jgi:hypothetical protein